MMGVELEVGQVFNVVIGVVHVEPGAESVLLAQLLDVPYHIGVRLVGDVGAAFDRDCDMYFGRFGRIGFCYSRLIGVS